MKNSKKVLALAMALTCAAGFTACSDSSSGEGDGGGHGYLNEVVTTTTAKTVEVNTETLNSEQQEQVNSLADSLPDVELANKTVKWLSFYDDWYPSNTGGSKPIYTELFETKYGGKIEWIETTWATQYDDFATSVLSGEGVDLFPSHEAVPKCVMSGMTQSFDQYVDWSNPLWQSVKNLNDQFEINGSHYLIVCNSTAGNVVFYNRQTIDELGYDDPKDLYDRNEWTLEKFKSMLSDFVDAESGTYGLDGWFNAAPLYLASGVPTISIKDGKISNNLKDPNLERAMNYQYDLFQSGLVLDKSLFSWNVQTQFIGEGKELFYISGLYEIQSDKEIWSDKFGEQMFFVPIPRDEKADAYYQNVGMHTFNLCKDAGNPEGTMRLMECVIAGHADENANRISDEKSMADFGWTDEMIEMKHEADRLASEHPMIDIYGGLSKDTADAIGDLINQPLNGTDWYSARDSMFDAVQSGVDDVNDKI